MLPPYRTLHLVAAVLLVCTPGLAATRVGVIGQPGAAIEKLATLVELRLGQQPGITLVERQAVDRILKEQQLQTILAAESTARRAALGKLLQADLLVTLGGSDKPKPHWDIVVCESHHGLRLCVQAIEQKGAEKDADAVAKLVRRAIDRNAEKQVEVVAVPPLVSNDLSKDYQTLQRPYTILIEQALLDRPGVLVVELAEAKALAEELALSSAPDIERRLPLYLLGDFRHEGISPDVKVTLNLAVARGTRRLQERHVKDLPPGEVATRLRREAVGLIDQALGAATTVPDPATEARQLADRAQLMFRLGSWIEAAELGEASLLLKPDQVAVHRLVADALGMQVAWLRSLAFERAPANDDHVRDQAWNAAQHDNQHLYLRGLPHLEYFLAHGRVVMGPDFGLIAGYVGSCEAKRELREIFLRALRAKYDARNFNDGLIHYVVHCQQSCFDGASEAEIMRWKLEAAKVFPVRPDQGGQNQLIFALTWGDQQDKKGRVAEFIKQLHSFDNPVCPAAAATLERRQKQGYGPLSDGPGRLVHGKPFRQRPKNPEVRFQPLDFPHDIHGWLPASPGVDVCWDEKSLYFLKGKSPKDFARIAGIHADYLGSSVCFDGRFVWAFQNPGDALAAEKLGKVKDQPRVLTLDPAAGRYWLITAREGLPDMPLVGFSVTPLGPGKVCAVGHFGTGSICRVWIALITLDAETGRGAVKVIHEARDTETSAHGSGWKNPHEAFHASRAFTISEPGAAAGKAKQCVLVDRRNWHPLLIDAQTVSVSVVSDHFAEEPNTFPVVHDGTLYWVGWSGEKRHLCRLGYPDLKPHMAKAEIAAGQLLFLPDRLLLVERDTQFWTAAGPDAPFRMLRTDHADPERDNHWYQEMMLFGSRHFGVVLYDRIHRACYQVLLPP